MECARENTEQLSVVAKFEAYGDQTAAHRVILRSIAKRIREN